MKRIKIFAASFIAALITFQSSAQNTDWSLAGNTPGIGEFLGSTNNSFLELRQFNTRRVRFSNTNWPGYNNAPAVANSNRVHFSLDGNWLPPFSMIHVGEDLNSNLSRPWMQVGTTYGAGGDILHFGILQSPDPSGCFSSGRFRNFYS